MTDWTAIGLSEGTDAVARGELSPVEWTNACLAQIEKLEPEINAFITVTAEIALAEARQLEAEILRGRRRGPLHGAPLALKDLFDTAGIETTAGARFLSELPAQEDAAVVQRLKAAGALSVGKLNMHEIALGVTNVNPHYGACRNPWDRTRISGGSSGGSAAALSARMVPGALGSDTGGSIRIPAALCGVTGLKPTRGRVSLRGVIPLSWNLDHAGPMARSVRDTALLLQVIAGYDPADPASVDRPVDDYLSDLDGGVEGWRVAVADDAFFTRVEDEILAAFQAAAQAFGDLGARVERVEVPEGRRAARANGLMTISDAAAFHRQRIEDRPEGFGEDTLRRLRNGLENDLTGYIQARRTQAELRRLYSNLLTEYDLLLTPATPITAPPIEGPDAVEQAHILTSFTAPFNLTGLPALALPCGFTRSGLPVGLQIVAAPWAEAKLLRGAQAYEMDTPWHDRLPAVVST